MKMRRWIATVAIAIAGGAVILTWAFWPKGSGSMVTVSIEFKELDCQQFILFFDPELDDLADSVNVVIDPDRPQALVLPPASGFDLKFRNAFWSRWEVGTFGGPGGATIGYDVLAVGRTAGCQIDRGSIPFPMQQVFRDAQRV